MSVTDEVAKIVKSFKPIDIKGEIKNPTIAPVVNYQSPTNNTYNFQSVQMDNTQLNIMVDKISDNLIEGIKEQVIGKIATNDELQNQITNLPPGQLPNFLRTAVVGTATLSEVQPNFITAGTTLFPKPEEVFKAGYETGLMGKKINNVKITRNPDNTITISYDET